METCWSIILFCNYKIYTFGLFCLQESLCSLGLSQRRQRLPYQSVQRPRAAAPSSKCSPTEQPFQTLLGLGNVIGGLASGIVNSETQTIFSPSQPNSSLLRLAGDGNIELGQFLSRIEEVRGHLNNATCTILQTTTLFVLPYMKLLAGQKLENACCEPFVDGWIQAIVRITGELKPESVGDEVDVMVTREFHALRTESQRLYKRMKKMFKRIKAPFDEHDRKSKKSLVKIHPKGGTSFITPKGRVDRRSKGNDAAPNNDLKDQEARLDSKTSVYFSPIPLSPRGTITLANLFKNHVYFSISKKEELMYKTEIDGEWQDFSTLPFGKRRDLFLSSIEDLRRTLKFPLIAAQQLKQLLIAGYPENITTNIRENLSYLKRISKQEDLLVLSKVTIGTQVNLLQECMDRLVRALHDTLKISKYFRDSIKSNCKARNVKCGVPISAANCIFPKEKYSRIITDVRLSLKFDNSPVKLMVPYSAPENSKGNAFPFY